MLVPKYWNVQALLKLTLGVLLTMNSCFNIKIIDVMFSLYIKISEITDDTSGLAKTCLYLNHNVLLLCRKCCYEKSKLFQFTTSKPKIQQRLKQVYEKAMLLISQKKHITNGCKLLQNKELKPE